MIEMNRRGLLGMFAAGMAAAIVRPGLVMPIKPKLVVNDGVALLSMAHPIPITRGGLILMKRKLDGGTTEDFRWVRESVMGEYDHENIARMYSLGFSPVDTSFVPALQKSGLLRT